MQAVVLLLGLLACHTAVSTGQSIDTPSRDIRNPASSAKAAVAGTAGPGKQQTAVPSPSVSTVAAEDETLSTRPPAVLKVSPSSNTDDFEIESMVSGDVSEDATAHLPDVQYMGGVGSTTAAGAKAEGDSADRGLGGDRVGVAAADAAAPTTAATAAADIFDYEDADVSISAKKSGGSSGSGSGGGVGTVSANLQVADGAKKGTKGKGPIKQLKGELGVQPSWMCTAVAVKHGLHCSSVHTESNSKLQCSSQQVLERAPLNAAPLIGTLVSHTCGLWHKASTTCTNR